MAHDPDWGLISLGRAALGGSNLPFQAEKNAEVDRMAAIATDTEVRLRQSLHSFIAAQLYCSKCKA